MPIIKRLKQLFSFNRRPQPKGKIPICRLCKVSVADKKNSHIVPRFLTKSLFPENIHKTLAIKGDGSSKEPQDTPKEDHLLCTACERRFEILETMYAPIIRQIHDYKVQSEKFEHIVEGQKEYLKSKIINPVSFRLFIYSIIWRLSVCSNFEFECMKLNAKIEESLRGFLDQNLQDTKKSLVEHLPSIATYPDYHLCLIKPKIKTNPPGGVLSAYSEKQTHLIMLVDFALFFITDDKSIIPALAEFSNKGSRSVLIGLGDNEEWIKLNRLLVHKMLNKG